MSVTTMTRPGRMIVGSDDGETRIRVPGVRFQVDESFLKIRGRESFLGSLFGLRIATVKKTTPEPLSDSKKTTPDLLCRKPAAVS